MTKLPRLYVGGKFSKFLHPISLSINQNITPLSTASITLPMGETLSARSYMEVFTPIGSAGMFRVRSPHNAYGASNSTAELEHMIAEIGDYVVKKEYDDMYSAKSAVKAVFEHYKGSHWKLGKYDAVGTGKIALECKYDSVLNALLSILDQKPDCMMTFDYSTTPWTVNIVKRGTSVVAEGRLSRNVTSATVTYDDSALITRVWYQTFTKDADGKVKDTWTSKDASTLKTYGVIEGTVSTSSDMTADEITTTVNTYLEDHKSPRVSVSIQATELSQITGERMDKFLIGDMFRLALPDYSTTVELNITAIAWSDVYNSPNAVSVTLGDEEDTIVTFLHNLDSTGSGAGARGGGTGGGGSKKKEEEKWKEYFTTIEQTDYNIRLNASRVDRANNILQQAGMSINANGVLIYAKDNENNVMSHIGVQADRISLVVEGTGKNAKIKPASIVSAINGDKSSIVISADRINLDGYVKATDLTANWLKSKIASISSMDVKGLTVTGNLYIRNGGGSSQNVNGAIWTLDITQDGDTYTLKRKRFSDSAWVDVGSFSRATTLSGAWSSGTLTVTASPQSETFTALLSTEGHWGYAQSEVSTTYYGTVSAKHNGGKTSHTTGASFQVDASGIYSDGYDDGYSAGQAAIPTPSNVKVSSSSSGTSVGTLSGASPGKYILFKVGTKQYNIFLT